MNVKSANVSDMSHSDHARDDIDPSDNAPYDAFDNRW